MLTIMCNPIIFLPAVAGGPSINRDPTTGSRASEPPAPSRGPGGSAKEPHATAGDEEFSMVSPPTGIHVASSTFYSFKVISGSVVSC